MKITTEINSIEYFEAWSGGKDTLDGIIELGSDYVDMLDGLVAMTFEDGECTDTELNDWLWFERPRIYEYLGLNEDGEIPEEDEDEELLENVDADSIKEWIENTVTLAVNEKDYTKVYYYNITNTKCIMLSWDNGYESSDGYGLEFSVRERESSYFVADWTYIPNFYLNSELIYSDGEDKEDAITINNAMTWIEDATNILL